MNKMRRKKIIQFASFWLFKGGFNFSLPYFVVTIVVCSVIKVSLRVTSSLLNRQSQPISGIGWMVDLAGGKYRAYYGANQLGKHRYLDGPAKLI